MIPPLFSPHLYRSAGTPVEVLGMSLGAGKRWLPQSGMSLARGKGRNQAEMRARVLKPRDMRSGAGGRIVTSGLRRRRESLGGEEAGEA